MSRSHKYPEEIREAAEHLRHAVPLMMRYQIPPTPYNYALWYDYVRGTDARLKSTLDQLVEQIGTCPPELSEELFLKFIVGEDLARHERSRETVSSLVSEMARNIRQSAKRTRRFQEEVNQQINRLANNQDSSTISSVLQALEASTAHLFENNERIETRLASTQQELDRLRQELEETQRAAFIDGLTQLHNRLSFDTRASQQLAEARTGDAALIMLDIDHFKLFNDRHGHLTGDRVLRAVAKVLQELAPENAICARFGGEEFAIVLPEGGLKAGLAYAEQVRSKVESLQIRLRETGMLLGSITVSMGVAGHRWSEQLDDLVERADTALYDAKRSGRNQVQEAAA